MRSRITRVVSVTTTTLLHTGPYYLTAIFDVPRQSSYTNCALIDRGQSRLLKIYANAVLEDMAV